MIVVSPIWRTRTPEALNHNMTERDIQEINKMLLEMKE